MLHFSTQVHISGNILLKSETYGHRIVCHYNMNQWICLRDISATQFFSKSFRNRCFTSKLLQFGYLSSKLCSAALNLHQTWGRIMCKCFGSVSVLETWVNWKPGLWLVDLASHDSKTLMLPKHLHMIWPYGYTKYNILYNYSYSTRISPQ